MTPGADSNFTKVEGAYSPAPVAVGAGRTSKYKASDWPDEEEEPCDMEVVLSTLFPRNDLARSRHCSASRSIRSSSKATLSLSSVGGTESQSYENNKSRMCCCGWEESYGFKALYTLSGRGGECLIPPPPFQRWPRLRQSSKLRTFVPNKLERRHQGARSSVYSRLA